MISLDLPITCCLPTFMALVFMMLLITYFQFILGLGLKERRGWTTLPLAYFVLSIARFIIIDNTVRTIRCLKILSLSTTVVVRIRIMEWSAFWTWSRREDSLVRILFIYILSSTQIMTVTTHLTALRCCTGRKNVFTFENSCEILNTRNNVEFIQMFPENFLGLVSFLNYIYDRPDPKTVIINHVFRLSSRVTWWGIV